MSVEALAVRVSTDFCISGVVASRCGLQTPQYHFETDCQSGVVLTSNRCNTSSYGGIEGSSNIRGTFLTSHRYTVNSVPMPLVECFTVPGISSRMTIRFSGLALGAWISYVK